VNGYRCDYCLAAHSAIGKTVGLTAEQIRDSRLGGAVDPRADTPIRLALEVPRTRGRVSDAMLAEVREAGFDDGAIAEVVAHVALDVFTNYLNNVAQTDVDFPRAPELTPEPATV
jgi:alkylhydroperoxidase family enzyme